MQDIGSDIQDIYSEICYTFVLVNYSAVHILSELLISLFLVS